VPWLLEASVLLQAVLHKFFEAGVIGGLRAVFLGWIF
jgi:hypothetical protein